MAQSVSQIIQDAQVDVLKVPPHSMEAEQSVVGGLMLENTAWDRIADLISDSDSLNFRRQKSQISSRATGPTSASQPGRHLSDWQAEMCHQQLQHQHGRLA